MPKQSIQDGLLLIEAAKSDDIQSVKELIKKGAYIHTQDKNGKCALVAAAYQNNLDIAEILIAAGADVNMKDDTLQSAYLIATSEIPYAEGYTRLLEMTLQAGADVHATDSYNGTGLIRAADRGYIKIIEILLKTDIRVNHINKIGWTALHEAVILGGGSTRHTEVVRLLIKAGADPGIPDKDGKTPLEHARDKGYGDMVKWLA